ncbi:MAG: hypothetical protein VYA14_04505 [Pseudomonadota bacterium]|nr:hypothetical protein [Pseudomonadota bacterium]
MIPNKTFFPYRPKERRVRITFSLLVFLASLVLHASQVQAETSGKEMKISSEDSWIRILAYPDGPLSHLGHHHVISHHNIIGIVDVASDLFKSNILLELAVADFKVDDPVLRKLEGGDFDGEVPQKDIDGTRVNMLGEDLLNVNQFPTIKVYSVSMSGNLPDINIMASVNIKGADYTAEFPANIELGENSFVASGQIEITHSELGLSPFTALGGLLSVRDVLIFKYEISGFQ